MSDADDRRLPAYRARPAWVESEPPGIIHGARVRAFGFEGRLDAMDGMLDRYLNAGAADGLVYRAVAPLAVITFLQGRLTSTSDPYGWLPDVECALWVPVASIRQGEVRAVAWFMPWVWVNTAAAMQTGYCVWGFAKSIGTCDIPAPGATDGRYELRTFVFDTLSPRTEGVVQPLLRVTGRKETVLERIEHALTGVSEAFSAAEQAFSGWISGRARPSFVLAEGMLGNLLHREVPVVNLKQFRDCAAPTRACYQAIVESTCTPSDMHMRLLPGAWRLDIRPCASHPLGEELGIPTDGIDACFAAEVDMDFTADLGREVWRAGAGVLV